MRSSARRRTSHVKRTARLGGATRRWRFCQQAPQRSQAAMEVCRLSHTRAFGYIASEATTILPFSRSGLCAGCRDGEALSVSSFGPRERSRSRIKISCIADSGRASNCSSTNSTPPTSRATHDHWPNKLPNHDQHRGHYNLRYFRRSEPNRAPTRGGRPGGSEDYQTSNASKADVALSLDERSIPGRCVASRLAPAA